MRNNYSVQQASEFTQVLIKSKLALSDLGFIVPLAGVALYLIVTQPLFVTVFGCASLVGMGIGQIVRVVPILEKQFRAKFRFWHIASVILAVTAVCGVFGAPAQAIFLSGLQAFLTQLASDAGTAGGGTAIEASTINLIFNALRGIFLLLVAAATLFAFNQSQQGNDWRPIATQIGLAFGIVLAIDVITFLFIGNTATPGA